jgi:hypothetical protein
MEEARFGLKGWYRRRWCPRGARPPWRCEDRYDWLWLYTAVEPTTGQSFCLFLPRLDGTCFELGLRAWRRAFPAEPWAVVLDHSGAHTSGHVRWPDGGAPVPLPAYRPELHPGERWFKALRAPLANHVHDHLDALAASLTQVLRPSWEHPMALVQLTAYPLVATRSRIHHDLSRVH